MAAERKSGKEEAFAPSELGTLEHWQNFYEVEVNNFESHGDIGEQWFGEDVVERVLRFIADPADEEGSLAEAMERRDLAAPARNELVLDLGCGNAHLIVGAAKEGFTNVIGLDYAESGVTLGRRVVAAALNEAEQRAAAAAANGDESAAEKAAEEAAALKGARVELCDILAPMPEHICTPGTVALALDKGTYDAISLHEDGERLRREYVASVARFLRPGAGVLVLTSCNWSLAELDEAFCSGDGAPFERIGRIRYPSFSFGGSTGSTVSTAALLRKKTA